MICSCRWRCGAKYECASIFRKLIIICSPTTSREFEPFTNSVVGRSAGRITRALNSSGDAFGSVGVIFTARALEAGAVCVCASAELPDIRSPFRQRHGKYQKLVQHIKRRYVAQKSSHTS